MLVGASKTAACWGDSMRRTFPIGSKKKSTNATAPPFKAHYDALKNYEKLPVGQGSSAGLSRRPTARIATLLSLLPIPKLQSFLTMTLDQSSALHLEMSSRLASRGNRLSMSSMLVLACAGRTVEHTQPSGLFMTLTVKWWVMSATASGATK